MKPGEKFSDEQLSRVLSAHEGGQLVRGGQTWSCDYLAGVGCAAQVALLIGSPSAAAGWKPDLASAFDSSYRERWTTTKFLRWLEAHGAA